MKKQLSTLATVIIAVTMRLTLAFKAASSSNPTIPQKPDFYDMIVIGGGSSGLTAAKFASSTLRKSVLIIDQSRMGGDCTWTGCVPSKSLLAYSEAARMTRKYAIDSNSKFKSNWVSAREYLQQKQKLIYDNDDSPATLERIGIETIEGHLATIMTYNTISLTDNLLSQSKHTGVKLNNPQRKVLSKEGIVICTGAKPSRPSIPGLTDIDYVTYEEIWTKDFGGTCLPERFTVIGSGPVGMELALALSRLGSKVTIVTGKTGVLLPSVDDDDVSELMENIFKNDENIDIVRGELVKVEPPPNNCDNYSDLNYDINYKSRLRHIAHIMCPKKEKNERKSY